MRFLTSMGRNAELRALGTGRDARSPDFVSSHPATPERVLSAQTSARQFSAPGAGEREKAEYLTRLDGLVYGEDPTEGYVRGRRYLNPRLGFTFAAPPGFALDNSAQAVFGVKDGGGQALRLDVVRVPADQSLAAYLKSGWIENIDERSVEEITINTLPAATAVAKGDQWTFRLYAVRFGGDVYRFIFAAKQRTAESDRAFRDLVGTFRRLSITEVDRVEAAAAAAGDGRRQRQRRAAGEPDGGVRPRRRTLPRAQRPCPRREPQAGRPRQARDRVSCHRAEFVIPAGERSEPG